MEVITEQELEKQYRTLSPHQRARIMIVHKACWQCANHILANTPHTPEVTEGIKQLRQLHKTAMEAITNERNT
jgi:hypothetical protein